MGSNDLAAVTRVGSGLLRFLLQQQEYVIFAYLFGSCAKGDVSALSDLDIAVYLSRGEVLRCQELKADLYVALSRGLGTNDIDIVVLNTASNLVLLDEILRCGILLMDRDPRLREDFEQWVMHRAIDFKTQRKAVLGF